MKTTYLAHCKTIEELKKEYRTLVKLHHPDNNGNESIMKAINNEYDSMFTVLQHIHNAKEENADNQNTEQPEAFRHIINTLMSYSNITIEICGSWLWVSGDTYQCKDTLKELGFKWASKKQMWYLGDLQRKTNKSTPMEAIRTK